MKYLSKEYVEQEILDTVALMQLNNENVPELSGDKIQSLAEDFIFEWKEVGDYSADLSRTLLEWLRETFKYMNYGG